MSCTQIPGGRGAAISVAVATAAGGGDDWVMAARKDWTHDDLLVVYRLYCYTPFGRLHRRNPEIIRLANLMGRTPSSVAMKACNFASLDPAQRTRRTRGLTNASQADRALWEAFQQDPEAIATQAEEAYSRVAELGEVIQTTNSGADEGWMPPAGPTESAREVRIRLIQRFFRSTVLATYESCCAISGIAIPELLNASHIIPWRASAERRADPRNGIALHALYDRAFDRGLITFDESCCLVLSPRLKTNAVQRRASEQFRQLFYAMEGKELMHPRRFAPDPEALEYHRGNIFCCGTT